MRRLFLPLIPLVAAVLADFFTQRQWLPAESLPAVGRAVLLVVFLLGWRLRRGRVAWAAIAIAAVAELGDAGLPPAALLLASLWLVADLAAAAVLREWWFLSQPGFVRLAVLAAQGLSVLWLAGAPEATRTRLLSFDDGWSTAWPPLERIPLEPLFAAALLMALLVSALAFAKRRSPLEAGFLWATLACFPAFAVDDGLRYFAAAAGLVLAVALVENAFSLAFNDGLTGLPARRALEERLEQLGRSYALAMLDLDHFKKLNDRHGHEVGDQVLRSVASRLKKAPGGGDAFRYGGEEFTVVYAGQSADEAAVYLDALRQQIGSRPFVVRSPGRPAAKPKDGAANAGAKTVEKSLKVTVSIGVAERSDKTPTPEHVMKAADRALYKSKKAGRNRVTVG